MFKFFNILIVSILCMCASFTYARGFNNFSRSYNIDATDTNRYYFEIVQTDTNPTNFLYIYVVGNPYSVVWGDGSVSNDITTSDIKHNYSYGRYIGYINFSNNLSYTYIRFNSADELNKILSSGPYYNITNYIDFGGFGTTRLQNLRPDYIYNQSTLSLLFQSCYNIDDSTFHDGFFQNIQNIDVLGTIFYGTSISNISYVMRDITKLTNVVNKIYQLNAPFRYCLNITNIPPNVFDNYESVTTTSSVFNDCDNLRVVEDGALKGLKNVRVKISFLPMYVERIEDNNFNTWTNITNWRNTFANMTNLMYFGTNNFNFTDGVSKSKNFQGCFSNCTKLTYAIPMWEWAGYSGVDMYYNCTNASNYADIPEDWK